MSGAFKVIVCAFVLFNVAVNDVYSHRILAIFPVNVKSHYMMFDALTKGLAKRGHQIDVMTHFPMKDPPPNYKILINLSGTLPNTVNNFTIDFVNEILIPQSVQVIAQDLGNFVCDTLLSLDVMQEFIKNLPTNPPYDLFITEAFAAHCFLGFGHLLKVPVIAVSSAIEYPWISSFIGNDDNPAYVSAPDSLIFDNLNFWNRLKNFYSYNEKVHLFHTFTEQAQTEAMRKYLSPDVPGIREVEKNVALLLVNSHPVITGAKPVTPALIQVGGLHIEETIKDSKLSSKLKTWLDESKDGFIYFSFGTMVLIETLPKDMIESLYDTFSKIKPVRVLMRVSDPKKLPLGLPSNVLTESWISQQEVLAHKNIKAFITHGGLMGSQEALYYGVPMIGVPLFSDQPQNVALFEAKKMTIKLTLDNLKTESFKEALIAVLKNPIYRDNAKYYSNLFKDRPMSAMDTAIFWIEFIIRNGGEVLKSPALQYSWWQLQLLDVYGFILLNFVFVLLIIISVLKFLMQKLKNSGKKLKKQ